GPFSPVRFASEQSRKTGVFRIFRLEKRELSLLSRLYGGEGGIRTPDTVSRIPVFKTGAINHSATSPTTTVLLQCGCIKTSWSPLSFCFQVITNLRRIHSPVFKTGAINHSATSPGLIPKHNT